MAEVLQLELDAIVHMGWITVSGFASPVLVLNILCNNHGNSVSDQLKPLQDIL